MLNTLLALSPLDGRYASKVDNLRNYFSEFALIKFRLLTEIEWLKNLAANPQIKELPQFSAEHIKFFDNLVENFSVADAENIKQIESRTNHDVKALEYWIRSKVAESQFANDLKSSLEFIHFACTSEDINNISHALMCHKFRSDELLPMLQNLIKKLQQMSAEYAEIPMMARTHGQPATPTTMGKEIANFGYRLLQLKQQLQNLPLTAKINGAVGNYNAHLVAYPEIDWEQHNQNFVEKTLGLKFNPYTIQIEPHDNLAVLFNLQSRINSVLIDLDRDIWGYISLNYFRQKVKAGEVGSSTMPHKVNPIDFENSEGNLGLANSVFTHLAEKLTISRWQRDLSDSTVLRNMGVGFGYTALAISSLNKGLDKLLLNEEILLKDLQENPELLAEPVQTVMRRFGVENAYDKLKAFTRGERVSLPQMREFIAALKGQISDEALAILQNLSPETYIGKAVELAKRFAKMEI